MYLELPSDTAYLDVEPPGEPLRLRLPDSDPERLAGAASAIADRLVGVERPAVLLVLDAERFGTSAQIERLARMLPLPVAVMSTSKSAFEETSHRRPARRPRPDRGVLGRDRRHPVPGRHTPAPARRDRRRRNAGTRPGSLRPADAAPAAAAVPVPAVSASPDDDAELTHADYWRAVQDFIRPGDVIIAENGSSGAGGAALRLPSRGAPTSPSPVWGSIGYTLAALVGGPLRSAACPRAAAHRP